jgi:hypothetical protein
VCLRRIEDSSFALCILPMRRVIVYGLAGGVLLALLKLLEYKHFVRAYIGASVSERTTGCKEPGE